MVYSSSIFYFDQCYRLTKKKISNFINKIYWNAGPAISESKLQVNFPRPFILTAVKRNRTAVNVNGVHLQAVFGGRERARARKVKKKSWLLHPGAIRVCAYVCLAFVLAPFFLLDSLSLLFVGYAFLRGADDSLLSRRWGACGRDRSRTFVKTYSHSTGFLYPIKREKKRRRTVPLITFQLNTHAHGHTTQNGEKKEKRKKNQSEVLECIWWKVVYAWERITLWLIFYYPTSE